MCRHCRTTKHEEAMVIEVLVAARRAEALQIFRRCVSMKVHGEQLALDEVGLRRQPQSYRNVSLAHREIELLLGGQQCDADVRIEFEEFAEARGEPIHAE